MANVKDTIYMVAPPERVWDFISDIPRHPDWIYCCTRGSSGWGRSGGGGYDLPGAGEAGTLRVRE